jgi:AGZA family xanthine/uracil permease-like MFS transporter
LLERIFHLKQNGTTVRTEAVAGATTFMTMAYVIFVHPPMLADAGGTIVGSLLGTSTVTTYIESAAGVEEGGRTGLTSLVVAGLFLSCIAISPIAAAVPRAATAPALIIVGSRMMSVVTRIDWGAPDEAVPAFLTIVAIPLTFSIANGLAMGFISYPLVKAFSGKPRDVSIVVYVLAGLFIMRFAMLSF